jgi:hypothetical protein
MFWPTLEPCQHQWPLRIVATRAVDCGSDVEVSVSTVVAGSRPLRWNRIPESRQTSGGFRLSMVVTVGSGQLWWIPTGLRVRMRVRSGPTN